MRAREMMNPFVVKLRPTDTVVSAAEAMRDECAGVVCVCGADDVPIGVLTDRDVAVRVCAADRPGAGTQLQEVMTHHPLVCQEDDAAEDVENAMKKRGVARVLVVDGQGKLSGIISLAEIWHHESPLLAGPVSRTITQRELRMNPTGSHASAAPSPLSLSSEFLSNGNDRFGPEDHSR